MATESNKSFRVSLVSGGQKGDLLVCDGEILSANFGLLEGNDALTELLFWSDGTFSVARVKDDEKADLKGNLKILLRQVNTFADQMHFLREASVGLNSEIVPSLNFGTQAWQEALARQPLFKEDYAVLGWITDGRTMRQAMREFSFDVVRATSSLFRLLSTGSVEILRPTLKGDDGAGEVPMSGLAALLDNILPAEDGAATFDASPQAADKEEEDKTKEDLAAPAAAEGGAMSEMAAATGQGPAGKSPPEKSQDNGDIDKAAALIKASEALSKMVINPASAQAETESRVEAMAQEPASSNGDNKEVAPASAALDDKSQLPSQLTAAEPGDAQAKQEAQPAKNADGAYDANTAARDMAPAKAEPLHHMQADPAPVAASRLVKNVDDNQQSSVGTATGATFNAVGGTMELSNSSSSLNAFGATMEITSSASALSMDGNRDVITCDSLPAVGSDEFNEIMAKAQKASEQPPDPDAPTSQAVTAQIHLPTSFRTSSDKLPVVVAPLTAEALPIATAAAMARQTIDMDVPKVAVSASAPKNLPGVTSSPPSIPVKAPVVDSASAWAAAVRVEPSPAPAASPSSSPAAGEESPEKRLFDIVRTDPLPIVAIDIERLFQTNFHISPFGHVSLGNDVLDSDLKKILLDFKSGKNFINVATEGELLPAQVLHYCKYCLERGYIDPPDAVSGLTADLLLGRVELEQYLLQRRRITGDELRDVMDVARQKSIKLTDLLVKLGFMTASDWDRLCQEKERFARR